MQEEETNALVRRCPRLGSDVAFAYCRESGQDKKPCQKVFDCWWETFDVVAFLKPRLSEDVFAELAHPRPQPKVVSLLELVKKIQDNKNT